MASQKQIEANRQNAAKSTGPRSSEGKAKVAGNALKHGLAGHGVILPEEMAGQIQDRMGHWRKQYRPDGPAQEWLFQRICIESVRADSCLHRVIALRDEAATRAGESWDDDRALDAEDLGASIGRRPELVQPRLLQSKHGALWLIAQWEELERQFGLLGEWSEPAKSRALDLLGVPIDARLGVWDGLAGDDPGALVREQVDALRGRLDDYLNDRDDRARADAMAGLAADGREVRRVLRYEGEALRHLRAWTRELRRLQNPDKAPTDRRSRTPALAEAPEAPDDRGPAPRAASPKVATLPMTIRGALDATFPPPPSNRQARRARAALERRNRRS